MEAFLVLRSSASAQPATTAATREQREAGAARLDLTSPAARARRRRPSLQTLHEDALRAASRPRVCQHLDRTHMRVFAAQIHTSPFNGSSCVPHSRRFFARCSDHGAGGAHTPSALLSRSTCPGSPRDQEPQQKGRTHSSSRTPPWRCRAQPRSRWVEVQVCR